MLVLPARSDVPFYDFEVDLEGRTYIFELRWNERSSAWFLNLRNAAGDILVAGRKVVIGALLGSRKPDPNLPPGQVFALDSSDANVDAGRNDLGARVLLVYRESTE